MNKFSNISDNKVNNPETTKAKEITDIEKFKNTVETLLEDLLKVKVYGGVRPINWDCFKITGQDLFIEALMELIDLKKKGLIKESSEIETESFLESYANKVRILDLFENELTLETANEQALRITDKDKALNRYNAAKSLIGTGKCDDITLEKISNIFLSRAKQLTF